MLNDEILEGLWEAYQDEWWHKTRLTKAEADAYHQRILSDGNIITVCDGNLLVSYCEFYKAHSVCYVKNLWVRKGYRLGLAIRKMRKRLFEVCADCKVFIGERNKFGIRYPEVQLRRN